MVQKPVKNLLSLTRTSVQRLILLMNPARTILVALVGLALTAYASDCMDTASPEQSMQCCQSMSCASHGHTSEDCCKSMQSVHAPFMFSAHTNGGSLMTFAFVVLSAFDGSAELNSSRVLIPVYSHAPPGMGVTTPLPLRI